MYNKYILVSSISLTHEGAITTSFFVSSNSGLIYQGRLRDDKPPPITTEKWDKRAEELIKRSPAATKVF